ncbi:MAG TPA: ferritin-like domain-containing protein [Thermoleophilaceae bacterium]|nr:ferritin-like domain-containing protein [Thermoleophilaceae bacterium]
MPNPKLAAPEVAAIEITGTTRQVFIMRSALAAGTVYGLASVGPFVSRAMAQEGGGDVEILNFALTLEYLEAAYYKQALAETKLASEVKSLATEIQENEEAHVEALIVTIRDLGGEPVKAPGVDFGKAFANEASFLELAQTLEDTGVSAYNGAAPAIESTEVLAAAGSIVQIEARHAAAIRLLRDENPAPVGFDEALSTDEVLEAVMPFVKA